jgi:hypothetical protein
VDGYLVGVQGDAVGGLAVEAQDVAGLEAEDVLDRHVRVGDLGAHGDLDAAQGRVDSLAGVLVLAGAWPGVRDKLPRTAIAHLVPGGPSFAADWSSMWDSPPIDPRAVAAQALIERNIPGDEALVLTEPDLGMEALMRSGRANVLPSSYPPNDEVDLPRSLPPVEDAVAGLEPGTLILTQAPPGPGEAPSKALEYQQLYGQTPAGSRLGPLAQAALDRIEERFRLVPVAKGPDGLAVVRLEPR